MRINSSHIAHIIVYLAIILINFSCGSTKDATEEKVESFQMMKDFDDVSYVYNPNRKYMHPSVQVFHNNHQESTISLQLFTHELLYTKLSRESALVADIQVRWGIRAIKNARKLETEIIDTNEVVFSIIRNEDVMLFFKDFKVELDTGRNYALLMEVRDIKRGSTVKVHDFIRKASLNNHQSFKIIDAQNNQAQRAPYILSNQKFYLQNCNQPKYYIVDYYPETEAPANPLFAPANSLSEFKPTQSWTISNRENRAFIDPDKPGYYFVRIDSNSSMGVGVLNLYPGFPEITEPDHMIGPLAYFTNEKILERIRTEKKKKLAVDKFWLNATGDQVDDARSAIRSYYNRTFLANYYFTSHKSGWQTDRGMIYILYGQPNLIQKYHGGELWTYYGKQAFKEVKFFFDHKPIPLSPQRYVLRRGSVENSRWREMIATWQSGKIFSYYR